VSVVAVTERRRRRLTDAEHDLVERSEGFWALAEAGYVSYRRGGHGIREVVGHKYVGRAVIGGLELRICEKAPGTVNALIATATGAELRIHESESPATDFDVVSRHLMGEFVSAAGRYVAERRRPRYKYESARGPVLAGSIDLARTVLLQTQGRLGTFAYEQGQVVRDEPLDRLVLAGLDELDRAAHALNLPGRTMYEARWLSGALEEVRDGRYTRTSRETFLEVADELDRAAETQHGDHDLAKLAAIALLHRGFEHRRGLDERVPRAWFLDLEGLFEQAVRETLRTVMSPKEVDHGEGFERRMFQGGTDLSRTYPDLVLHEGAAVIAAGDVKYKTLAATLDDEVEAEPRRKREGRPDLYQLLLHAASLSASVAFLVYVADADYGSRYLGISATGCATWAAEVRPCHLAEDLERFLDEMALLGDGHP